MTQEEFIEKAVLAHGDFYNYTKTVFMSKSDKFVVTCPVHGDFQKDYCHFINHKQGCRACSEEKIYGAKAVRTQEDFLARAPKIHNNKYDYSKTVYNGRNSGIVVICPVHGEFTIKGGYHVDGYGCQKCSLENSKTCKLSSQEEFITKAKAKHGDFYDYSKTVYINSRSPIIVTCPVHGDWEVSRAEKHLRHGCPDCGKIKVQASNFGRKLTGEEFITKAKIKHGDFYNYSLVNYTTSDSEVLIICPKHGEFTQKASSHIYGGKGCLECGNEQHGEKSRLTLIEFISSAKKAHGDKYDYSKVKYTTVNDKVTITCPTHGDFEQLPISHIYKQKSGCPKCGEIRHAAHIDSLRIGNDEFIRRSKDWHGDKYDYSKVDYVNKDTKVEIYCKKCKQHFMQTPHAHTFGGYGCLHCHSSLGELAAERLLDGLGIKFEREKKFDDCINETRHLLPFDFYLPDQNICLEIDGVHHRKTIGNNDSTKLEKFRKNDLARDTYCHEHDIKMIRIDYITTKQLVSDISRILNPSPVKSSQEIPWFLNSDKPDELIEIERYLSEEETKYINGVVTPWHFDYGSDLFNHEWGKLKRAQTSITNRVNYTMNLQEWYHKHLWWMNDGAAIKEWENNKEVIIADRDKYANNPRMPRSLRRYFKIRYVVPNMFNDGLAKFMASEINGNTIFDPFVGFGGRMTGTASLGKHYIGDDISKLSINANLNIAKVLNLDVDIRVNDSSNGPDVFCDGAITSPPFFNLDRYGDGGYKSLSEFQEKMNATFKRIKVEDKVIIDFKETKNCSYESFKRCLPFDNIEEKQVFFGGMGHKSYHVWYYCSS